MHHLATIHSVQTTDDGRSLSRKRNCAKKCPLSRR